MKISVFNNIKETTPSKVTNVEVALNAIKKGGKHINIINKLREENGDHKVLKAQLPVVTWAGTFQSRTNKGIIKFSGLMYFDIDKVKDTDFEKLQNEPFVYAIWRSCRGKGIGFLIQCNDLSPINFSNTHKKIQEYFKNKEIIIDNLSDICRANYLSYDPSLWINHSLTPLDAIEPDIVVNEKYSISSDSDFEKAHISLTTISKRYGTFEIGNRNNFVFNYASFCNQLGVVEREAVRYLLINGITHPDIPKIVGDTYKRYSSQFNSKNK